MKVVVTVSLLVVGAIHLLPAVGALGPRQLKGLYGIETTDPSIVVLLRHRAVLFGVLGAGFVTAAFVPAIQWAALGVATVAVVSYLTMNTRETTDELQRVGRVDLVALATVAIGAVARVVS